MFPLLTLSPPISPGPEICFFSAYYKYIIIRNREYLFLCNSNHRFYENFQNIKKEPFPDSSLNLNLSLYEPMCIINHG